MALDGKTPSEVVGLRSRDMVNARC